MVVGDMNYFDDRYGRLRDVAWAGAMKTLAGIVMFGVVVGMLSRLF